MGLIEKHVSPSLLRDGQTIRISFRYLANECSNIEYVAIQSTHAILVITTTKRAYRYIDEIHYKSNLILNDSLEIYVLVNFMIINLH